MDSQYFLLLVLLVCELPTQRDTNNGARFGQPRSDVAESVGRLSAATLAPMIEWTDCHPRHQESQSCALPAGGARSRYRTGTNITRRRFIDPHHVKVVL
jgi:hypothetical protein